MFSYPLGVQLPKKTPVREIRPLWLCPCSSPARAWPGGAMMGVDTSGLPSLFREDRTLLMDRGTKASRWMEWVNSNQDSAPGSKKQLLERQLLQSAS